ncbi:unnamed protein product [Ectocarpus sp. CCAP 1310/34]|nr:unnamed protein product [Ectocarpus sp. CCAP 1310/34]
MALTQQRATTAEYLTQNPPHNLTTRWERIYQQTEDQSIACLPATMSDDAAHGTAATKVLL